MVDPTSLNPGKNVVYDPNNPFNVGVAGTGNYTQSYTTDLNTGKPAVVSTNTLRTETIPEAKSYIASVTPPSQVNLLNPNDPYYQNNPYAMRPEEIKNPTLYNQRVGVDQAIKNYLAKNKTEETLTGNNDKGIGGGAFDYVNRDLDEYKARIISANDELANSSAQLTAQFESFKGSMDAALQGVVSGIQANYTNAIAQQKKINDAYLNSVTQSGVRSGQQRYAQESNASTVMAEAQAGVDRITKLEQERDNLIAQANQASLTKKWDMYYQVYGALQKNRSEQTDNLQKLFVQSQNAMEQAQKASQAHLAEIKASNEIYDKNFSAVALGVAAQLTGDEKADTDFIRKTALENGFDPGLFLGQVAKEHLQFEKAAKTTSAQTDTRTGIVNGVPHDILYDRTTGKQIADLGPHYEKPTAAERGDYKPPTSYQEWELAGKPGTYADWLKSGGNKPTTLSAGQKDDLATGRVLKKLSQDALDLGKKLNWSGTGGLYQGSMSQFMAKAGISGTEQEQTLRNLIGNITGTLAKLRGGTSFTPNEQKLLETYSPTIDDSPTVLVSKLKSLQRFIDDKEFAITGGASTTGDGTTFQSSSGKTYNLPF